MKIIDYPKKKKEKIVEKKEKKGEKKTSIYQLTKRSGATPLNSSFSLNSILVNSSFFNSTAAA